MTKDAVQTMLQTIEKMKYFLRTAYGNSKRFRGSKIGLRFQGLCQGCYEHTKEWVHGAKCVCPVSLAKGGLSAMLFVDDTDVIHLDVEKNETAVETHANCQWRPCFN